MAAEVAGGACRLLLTGPAHGRPTWIALQRPARRFVIGNDPI